MKKTTIITLFFGLFSAAAYFEGVVFGEQESPSIEEVRLQIKPEADLLSDWNKAQKESIDEAKRRIAVDRERIEKERQEREAKKKRRRINNVKKHWWTCGNSTKNSTN